MYKSHRVCAIVQARMASTRLPGKVLLPIGDSSVLELIVQRVKRSAYVDDVIVATTTNESDEPIVDLCNSKGIKYYRGSEEDVLGRVLSTANHFNADIIVEITGDCPFIDSIVINRCIQSLVDTNYDYVSNVIERTYARGLDVQVFWKKTLQRVSEEVDNPIDRQHVSTWIYRNPKSYKSFHTGCVRTRDYDTSEIRLTLDTEDDYKLILSVYNHFGHHKFDYKDLFVLFCNNPQLKELNSHIPQKSYEEELIGWYEANDKV